MTWHNRNLYLIGLPGSGKSAIGRELAQLLERFEFLDLDCEIEDRAGVSVAEIFAERGESDFREMESAALLRVVSATGNPKIIATGGGIILDPTNRAILRGTGIPIWIDVTIREAAHQIWNDILNGHQRPMFVGMTLDEIKAMLTRLLEERRRWYEQAVLHFVRRAVTGSEHSPRELAAELLIALDKMSLSVALKPPHRTLIAKSIFGNYPIFVGNGIAAREIGYFVREHSFENVFIVTDETVAALHLESFHRDVMHYTPGKSAFHSIILPSGERHKNLETLFRILEQFHAHGAARRTSLVVGFGGGVVTDMAALAAHLFHRGLPLALVPTSLIAQADASIGGKTGIDAFGHKNTIGTFYVPRIIAVDPLLLRTLPERERNSGLAEILKYALIGDPELWVRLRSELTRLLRGTGVEYEQIVFDAIKEKLRYIERDEFEHAQGIRELLNFGHTFGHALEAATSFESFLHGEAVLLGMRAASWLSKELGYLKETEWNEMDSKLGTIAIPHPTVNPEQILTAFLRDKKGPRRVILLRNIGEAFVSEISEADARRAIQAMLTIA